MKRLFEKNRWYVLLSIFFLIGFYGWLFLCEFKSNQFYGLVILFTIAYFYTKQKNQKNRVFSDDKRS